MMMSLLEGNDNNSNSNSNSNSKVKKLIGKKVDKRRFSEEQIGYLDLIFESESKLDPRKKTEVARKLGLQPRQVAIWFQNKRARCKSKQIEKEYSLLLTNYNNLSARFQSINAENQSLQNQLENLKKEMRGKENEEWEGGARNGGSDGEWESNKIEEFQVKNDDDSINNILPLLNINIKINSDEEKDELVRMADSLDSDDIIINQSSCQWWGFWS